MQSRVIWRQQVRGNVLAGCLGRHLTIWNNRWAGVRLHATLNKGPGQVLALLTRRLLAGQPTRRRRRHAVATAPQLQCRTCTDLTVSATPSSSLRTSVTTTTRSPGDTRLRARSSCRENEKADRLVEPLRPVGADTCPDAGLGGVGAASEGAGPALPAAVQPAVLGQLA